MSRGLECIHCGATMTVNPRLGGSTVGLVAHLSIFHGEVGLLDVAPRWAELLEHFRIVPPAGGDTSASQLPASGVLERKG